MLSGCSAIVALHCYSFSVTCLTKVFNVKTLFYVLPLVVVGLALQSCEVYPNGTSAGYYGGGYHGNGYYGNGYYGTGYYGTGYYGTGYYGTGYYGTG
jgi:hypothetical protein